MRKIVSHELPPVLGVTEVQELLGLSQSTVLRLAREGEIVGRKLGNGRTASWAFTGDSVAEYIASLPLEEVADAG